MIVKLDITHTKKEANACVRKYAKVIPSIKNINRLIRKKDFMFYSVRVDTINGKTYRIPETSQGAIDYAKMSKEEIIEYVLDIWNETGVTSISKLPDRITNHLPKEIKEEILRRKYGCKIEIILSKTFHLPLKDYRGIAWTRMQREELIEYAAYKIIHDKIPYSKLPIGLRKTLTRYGIKTKDIQEVIKKIN